MLPCGSVGAMEKVAAVLQVPNNGVVAKKPLRLSHIIFNRLFNGLLEASVRYASVQLTASTKCMALVFNPRWWMPSMSCSRHPLQLVAISDAPMDSRLSILRFAMPKERS